MLGDCRDHAWGCTALGRAVRVMLIKLWSGVQLAGKERAFGRGPRLLHNHKIPGGNVQTCIHNSELYFRDHASRLRSLTIAVCARWHNFYQFLNTSTNIDEKTGEFTYDDGQLVLTCAQCKANGAKISRLPIKLLQTLQIVSKIP